LKLELPSTAYRQLNRLRIHTSRHLRGRGMGQRAGARRRPAADFRDHRKYVPGDDIRFVDWKASARHEQIFLKQGEQPHENTVHLLIDTSASMAWGQPPKRDATLLLAAALGYLALANEDRLQVIPLHTAGRDGTAPARFKGKARFPALLNFLSQIPFGGRIELNSSLREAAKNHRGGVIILLSDLLDAGNLAAGLRALPPPAWDVTVLHLLHPHELAPDLHGEFEMVDAESSAHTNYDITPQALAAYHQHLQTWRAAIELACIQNHALYTLLSTGWQLDREMLPHLQKLGILERT